MLRILSYADTKLSANAEDTDAAARVGHTAERNVYDLKQLAFAVFLFELVIAALTVATRAFFGVRTAVWVGLGIGVVVLVAFVLITLFCIFTHAMGAFLARRDR